MARNQCSACLWFAKWDDLAPVTIIDVYSDYPPREAFVHVGATSVWPFDERSEACMSLQKPNEAKRAARALDRCPECRHGRASGHRGRACPQGVRYSGGYAELDEYDTCGCTYRNREIEKPKRKKRAAR